jgi:hypothetical protein
MKKWKHWENMTPYIKEKGRVTEEFFSETMETWKKGAQRFSSVGKKELSTQNSISRENILQE